MPSSREPQGLDLLAVPLVGRFLRWRQANTALRLALLFVAILMVVHGLAGPALAPKNLATVLTWLHFRGFLVLGLLLLGNLFCMGCPFILVRDWARRLLRLDLPWPRMLRHKWPAVVLFGLLLYAYELFDLWGDPLWTVGLLLAYFIGATLVGVLYRRAAFCTSLCPLGQFSLVSSLLSPFEVRIRDRQVCAACPTWDCIRGREGQQGCELGLFQPRKLGNMNCHLRLDCLRACPYDNVGLFARLPAGELWEDPRRSGIGRFSRRADLAVLVALYTFGALINAFGMVTPVYALEQWLADLLGTRSEAVVLGLLFLVGLVLLPGVLLWLTAAAARWASGAQVGVGSLINRYIYALVPMGFGVWVSHFAFHFLTGLLTIVPLLQSILIDLGWPALGQPLWHLGPILPEAWLFPVEVGLLGLGWLGSLLVAYRIAERERSQGPWAAFWPWAVLITLILAAAVWLMAQPMEMRGTMLGG